MEKNSFELPFFSIEKQEITEEIVEYYRKHPEELDLIIDKERFYTNFMAFFFFLGLTISVVARLLKLLFGDSWGGIINDLVLDIASELGIAIFGGAITAFFLEYLQKRQYEQNLKFRNEVKARM